MKTKKFLHGTRCDLVPMILREGLRIDCEPVHKISTYEGWKNVDEKLGRRAFRCGVYLVPDYSDDRKLSDDGLEPVSTEIMMAHDWATDAARHDLTRDKHPDAMLISNQKYNERVFKNACILKVENIPKGIRIGSDGMGYAMANRNIPPESITSVLYPKDICKILKESAWGYEDWAGVCEKL